MGDFHPPVALDEIAGPAVQDVAQRPPPAPPLIADIEQPLQLNTRQWPAVRAARVVVLSCWVRLY